MRPRGIYDCIAEFDLPKKADHVLYKLLETAEKLATFPEEGLQPRELRSLGIHKCRQVFFKPYRLIYRVFDEQVTST